MKVRLVKEGFALVPYDTQSEEWLHAKASGQWFECEIKTPRNYKFLKKAFALLNIAYQHWEPEPIVTEFGEAEKSFEQMREDLTIMCGFYKVVRRINGKPKIVAKSWSYAEMDDDEFSVLYDRLVTKIIQTILLNWSIEEVHKAVGNFL